MGMPFYSLSRHPKRTVSQAKRLASERLEQLNRRENADLPSFRLTPRPLMTEETAPPSNVTPLNPGVLPSSLTDEAVSVDDVRDRVRAAIEGDKTITQSRVSRESGVSSTTVSQFLSGTYPGDLPAIATKLARWLASLAERTKAAALPAAPAWVETRQARTILGALRYAQIGGDIVVIYGRPACPRPRPRATTRRRRRTPSW